MAFLLLSNTQAQASDSRIIPLSYQEVLGAAALVTFAAAFGFLFCNVSNEKGRFANLSDKQLILLSKKTIKNIKRKASSIVSFIDSIEGLTFLNEDYNDLYSTTVNNYASITRTMIKKCKELINEAQKRLNSAKKFAALSCDLKELRSDLETILNRLYALQSLYDEPKSLIKPGVLTCNSIPCPSFNHYDYRKHSRSLGHEEPSIKPIVSTHSVAVEKEPVFVTTVPLQPALVDTTVSMHDILLSCYS